MNDKKRPSSLIKQNRIVPKENVYIPAVEKKKEPKRSFKNQTANIKVSEKTKQQIEILIKLTDHKFSYQVIESLIDIYVDKFLEVDKKRAFRALSDLIDD